MKSKSGSIFIEASIVLPLTCIILISMITIAMSFYSGLGRQVREHKEELANESYALQIAVIRSYEKGQ